MANASDLCCIADGRGLRMSIEFTERPVLSSLPGFWVTSLVPDGPATVRLEVAASNMGDFIERLGAFVDECRDAMAKGGSDNEHR